MTVGRGNFCSQFKLDGARLPSFLGVICRMASQSGTPLNCFDHVAEFFGEHPKQEYHALLRLTAFVPQPSKGWDCHRYRDLFLTHVPCFLSRIEEAELWFDRDSPFIRRTGRSATTSAHSRLSLRNEKDVRQ